MITILKTKSKAKNISAFCKSEEVFLDSTTIFSNHGTVNEASDNYKTIDRIRFNGPIYESTDKYKRLETNRAIGHSFDPVTNYTQTVIERAASNNFESVTNYNALLTNRLFNITSDTGKYTEYFSQNPVTLPPAYTPIFTSIGGQYISENSGILTMKGSFPASTGHPNSNKIVGALSDKIFSGNFSISHRVVTALINNIGFCGITFVDTSASTLLIGGNHFMFEVCDYAVWASPLWRRGYSYTYASYSGANTTFTTTRVGSTITTSLYNSSGSLIVSGSITLASDLKVLIYYCRDAAGDAINTIYLDSFTGF